MRPSLPLTGPGPTVPKPGCRSLQLQAFPPPDLPEREDLYLGLKHGIQSFIREIVTVPGIDPAAGDTDVDKTDQSPALTDGASRDKDDDGSHASNTTTTYREDKTG